MRGTEMAKDNSTGKNKDFYDLGKRMFDRLNPTPDSSTLRGQTMIDLTRLPAIDAERMANAEGDVSTAALFARLDDINRAATAMLRALDESDVWSSTHPASSLWDAAEALELILRRHP
jgi:hypothetical protein